MLRHAALTRPRMLRTTRHPFTSQRSLSANSQFRNVTAPASTLGTSQITPVDNVQSSALPHPHVRVIRFPSQAPAADESPDALAQGGRSAPDEPYDVSRTRTGGLPVYKKTKGHGTLLLTHVRRIEGDLEALKQQLALHLQPPPRSIDINWLTKHINIKGDYLTQVSKFLIAKGF